MADTLINGISVPFVPIGGVNGPGARPPVELPREESFEKILKGAQAELKFSKHAQERIESRQISLNETDIGHLKAAVAKAEEKGSHDSLIFLRDTAFIVSVANRTVVTAVSGDRLRENVFTNIDSAVIAG